MKKALVIANAASMIHLFNEENIRLLKENGYEVHVVCNFFDGNTTSREIVEECRERWEKGGIICHQVDFLRTPFSFKQFSVYRSIKKIIKDNNFDIIHCHTPITSVLTRLAARKSRRHGTKVIYTAHGFHFYKGASIINWLIYFTSEWFCSFFTDVLLTINEEDFKRAGKFMHSGVVEYIPGVGIDLYSIDEIPENEKIMPPEFGITNETVILSVGEINANKNHEVIIRALAGIDKPYKYIICGKGDKIEYLENLAQKLGVQDKIILTGYRSDVKELLACVDIFCFPSYREGLSVSLMEAMASRLPIIASDIRGNVDLIDCEKGGYLYLPEDVEGFRKGLSYLMDNPEVMAEFGEYNHEKIKNFTKEIVSDKMKKFYFGDTAKTKEEAQI